MSIEVDVAPVVELLGNMSDRVQSFGRADMGPELVAWQQEDMRRRYPNIEYVSNFQVVTLIWPRSRTYEERRRAQPQKAGPQRKLPRLKAGTPIGGQRPILRPALLERLAERMGALMETKITWR